MTTVKAVSLQPIAGTSVSQLASRRVVLPSAITDTSPVDGWRGRLWVTRELSPGEALEIQQALLHLDMRLQSAPEGVTMAHVSRLLNHWNDTRSEQEKEWRFEDWAEDLEEFSEAHLKAACTWWRQVETFPPKIADIRGYAITLRDADKEHHRRCRVLLKLEEPRKWEVLPARQQAMEMTPDKLLMLEKAIGRLDGPR